MGGATKLSLSLNFFFSQRRKQHQNPCWHTLCLIYSVETIPGPAHGLWLPCRVIGSGTHSGRPHACQGLSAVALQSEVLQEEIGMLLGGSSPIPHPIVAACPWRVKPALDSLHPPTCSYLGRSGSSGGARLMVGALWSTGSPMVASRKNRWTYMQKQGWDNWPFGISEESF